MTRPNLKPIALALIFLMPFAQSAQACEVLCIPHFEWPEEGVFDRPASSDAEPKKPSEEEKQ